MKKKKKESPKGLKAHLLSVGDRLEGGLILGLYKGRGRYYFLVEEHGKYTILMMSGNCVTYPNVARNVPEDAMKHLCETFINNMEN